MIIRLDALDPRTIRDIRTGGCSMCEPDRRKRAFVCEYHEGYDAALEQYGAVINGAVTDTGIEP